MSETNNPKVNFLGENHTHISNRLIHSGSKPVLIQAYCKNHVFRTSVSVAESNNMTYEQMLELATIELIKALEAQLNVSIDIARKHGVGFKINGLLGKVKELAAELAQYASYAEIVGGISVNKEAIRAACDKVFDVNREISDLEDSIDQ